jgi:hypothetical protein
MKRYRWRWAAGLLMLLASTSMASDLSEFLHKVFDENVGRQPSGAELNYQANLMRNQGPLDNYLTILSSDDYFTNRAQRSYEVYVTNLYRTLLLREPRPDEVRYWVNQFASYGADRRSVLENFLRSYHVTQLPSFPAEWQPASYRVPANGPEIASELVSQVSLFNQTFAREVGGTRYGRGVLEQAARLLSVATQYRSVLQSRATTDDQLQIAANNLERALQDLETEFSRVPGASTVSRQILNRISQLVSAARAAHQGRDRPDTGGGWPSSGPSDVFRDVEAFRNQLQSFAYGLRHYQHRGPDYERFSRDVQSLAVQIDALSLALRQGQSSREVRRIVGSILTQADSISGESGQVDMNIQRGWWAMQQRLQAIAGMLGVSHAWSPVNQPVVLDHPVWQQLGSQPRTDVGLGGRNREVVDLADQTLAKIDEALRALTPLAGRSSDVADLRSSVQNLEHEVQVLRQTAAIGGYGSGLTYTVNRAMDQYRETSQQFASAVARDTTLNTPLFYQIGELLQRTRNAVAGVST